MPLEHFLAEQRSTFSISIQPSRRGRGRRRKRKHARQFSRYWRQQLDLARENVGNHRMPFVSYAQNFEDVMLWRALKHVDQGFYIDVGAGAPREDSVTCAFSQRGWRGVNIESNPHCFAQLVENRRRDINLRAGFAAEIKNVELSTLNTIWSNYVPADHEVQFLKIYVDGFEDAIIRGNNWLTNRPWIVVVKSAYPNSPIDTYINWESYLVSYGYIFCYADGLNRFYVAQEHSDLIPHFKYPPNIFDGFEPLNNLDPFVTAREADLRQALSEVNTQLEQARAQLEQARAQLGQATVFEAQVFALTHSSSWRLTEPLRRLVGKKSPRTRRNLRRTLKALWWAMTPWHIPTRIRFIRERNACVETGTLPSEAHRVSPRRHP